MVGLFRRVWTTVVPKNLQAPVQAMTQEMVARQDQDEISRQQWHHEMMANDIQRYFELKSIYLSTNLHGSLWFWL